MKLLIVVKVGISEKGCIGIYDSFDRACDVAKEVSRLEDGYHTFEVRPITLNKPNYELDSEMLSRYKDGKDSTCDSVDVIDDNAIAAFRGGLALSKSKRGEWVPVSVNKTMS